MATAGGNGSPPRRGRPSSSPAGSGWSCATVTSPVLVERDLADTVAAEGGGYGPVTFTLDLGAKPVRPGKVPRPSTSGLIERCRGGGDHSRTGPYADRSTVRVWVRTAGCPHCVHRGVGWSLWSAAGGR